MSIDAIGGRVCGARSPRSKQRDKRHGGTGDLARFPKASMTIGLRSKTERQLALRRANREDGVFDALNRGLGRDA
jgi:hypothetical protein